MLICCVILLTILLIRNKHQGALHISFIYLVRRIKEHFKNLEENIEGDLAREVNIRLRKLEWKYDNQIIFHTNHLFLFFT